MDSVKGEKYIKLIKEFLTIKSGKILKGTRFNLHLILDKTVLKESYTWLKIIHFVIVIIVEKCNS